MLILEHDQILVTDGLLAAILNGSFPDPQLENQGFYGFHVLKNLLRDDHLVSNNGLPIAVDQRLENVEELIYKKE